MEQRLVAREESSHCTGRSTRDRQLKSSKGRFSPLLRWADATATMRSHSLHDPFLTISRDKTSSDSSSWLAAISLNYSWLKEAWWSAPFSILFTQQHGWRPTSPHWTCCITCLWLFLSDHNCWLRKLRPLKLLRSPKFLGRHDSVSSGA